jgi:thiol-disulfide isomerase/thioredoxin
MRWRRLPGLLLLTLISALAVAAAREVAPPFTAKTLNGETFTSDSLKGKVALIQFWTTWCPICTGEEAGLDSIMRDFAGEGLVVLAVDKDEDRQTVKEYLAEHPRSCPIVLTEDTNLVAAFPPKGNPQYVLIDRDGTVAQNVVGGGEQWLRSLLRRVGIGRSAANAASGGVQGSAVQKTAYSSSPKIIEVPPGPSAPPAKPRPPSVFLLKNGEKLEARRYTITGGSLHITADGKLRVIPLTELDLKATLAANHERGINLKIPTNPNEVVMGF